MLSAGDTAPDFTLSDETENPVRLADLRGSWVVLWWFPKASTGG
jgi:thioredoxin-dependent peroxiredoxin